ncbi:MAG: ATP-binding protein, partial [Desulfuromonadales bacterium]
KYALRIVDSAKDPLLVLDHNLRIKTANPAFYEKFKVGQKETEGQDLFALGKGQWDQPELRRLLGNVLPSSSRIDNYSVDIDVPHLGPRTLMFSARKMDTDGSPYGAILLSIEDVTEQKQLEEYLRRAKKEAEEASRAKSEFLANISHEIRTPMTVIVSSLQLLENTDLTEQQTRFREMASKSTTSLMELLEDLLDFTRIEVGKVTIHSHPFDLLKNVEDAIHILSSEASAKGLDFKLNIAEEIPRTVRADRKRLRQILVNLVGNAIKFTEEGEIEISLEVSRDSPPAPGSRCLLFSVCDTGIGIPAEEINRLFDRFTQIDSSSTRKYGGTGLGLAICKGLVERMGGAIWVESNEGEGSTFFFTIPLKEDGKPVKGKKKEEAEPPDQKEAPLAYAVSEKGKSASQILLGEDDPAIQELITLMLSNWGLDVIKARTGREVLDLFRAELPALILLDLQLPEIDGLEAARTIRGGDEHQDVPIIGLTAHVLPEDRKKCLNAGMNDVVCKPVDFEKLQETILFYLED